MIYPPISLHKDGAFMLCEDAAEMDTNYDPQPAEEPEVKATIVVLQDIDPLDKFAQRMGKLYADVVEPMMNQDFSYENADQAIEMAERLASDTSNIFNTMRIKLLKVAGIVCGGITEQLAKEPFRAHAGVFMRNAALIKQQGIEAYPITWKEIPGFSQGWSITQLVDSIAARPDVLKYMLYEQELNALTGGFEPLRNFNGFVDLMQCLFRDRARLERLSVQSSFNLTYQQLMADEGLPLESSYRLKEQQTLLVKYLNLLSGALREVAQTCYELQVGLVDNKVTPECYEAKLRPLITKVVNLFGIGVAIGCFYAMALRRALAIQRGCEAYTKLLLDTIKEHGGKM